MGIIVDMSHWNAGKIDFEFAKKYGGVEGVMLKAGQLKKGVWVTDNRLHELYAGAKQAGLNVGLYFYSTATINKNMDEEVLGVMNEIVKGNMEITLPICGDYEEPIHQNYDGLINVAIKRQGKAVENTGYVYAYYCNNTVNENFVAQEVKNRYPLWLARYTRNAIEFPDNCVMWQFSSSNLVPGVGNAIDCNLLLDKELPARCREIRETWIKEQGSK